MAVEFCQLAASFCAEQFDNARFCAYSNFVIRKVENAQGSFWLLLTRQLTIFINNSPTFLQFYIRLGILLNSILGFPRFIITIETNFSLSTIPTSNTLRNTATFISFYTLINIIALNTHSFGFLGGYEFSVGCTVVCLFFCYLGLVCYVGQGLSYYLG